MSFQKLFRIWLFLLAFDIGLFVLEAPDKDASFQQFAHAACGSSFKGDSADEGAPELCPSFGQGLTINLLSFTAPKGHVFYGPLSKLKNIHTAHHASFTLLEISRGRAPPTFAI